MAEIERTEHGDSGKARTWTLRAVRARHDPVWTADGYVSDRWRPVSPVTGRIDAFKWQTPVASLPSDKSGAIESSPFEEAMLAAPPPRKLAATGGLAEPSRAAEPAAQNPASQPATQQPATQDNSPPPAKVTDKAAEKVAEKDSEKTVEKTTEPAPTLAPPAPPPLPPQAAEPVTPPPLFRSRADLAKPASPPIPAIIPVVRAPDDPGVDDDEAPPDEFADQIGTPKAQAGGWRGFWSRLGG
jgi:HemY protein